MSEVKLYLGDCLEILPTLVTDSVNAVITDPPYPDANYQEYLFTPVNLLERFDCRQLLFWSNKAEFPLSYTAIHIWDKLNGGSSQYERIFERNGNKKYQCYRQYLINSTVAANYTGDIFTGHPSQKPIRLIKKLMYQFTNEGDTILDPFMGSGTTGVACVQTGRNFIGIEIEPKYFEIAEKRIAEAQLQLRFDM